MLVNSVAMSTFDCSSTPEMVSTKIRNARVDIAAGALQRAREEARSGQPLRKLDSPVDLSIKRA